jgi:Fe-S cluster biogenesis protein NfuA
VEQPVTFIAKPEAQNSERVAAASEPAAAAAEVAAPETTAAPTTAPAGEPGEMRAEVEAAIEAIRPALQMDGGDITLVGVDESNGVVDIELIGACVGCPASTMTLKAGIERILKDRVEGLTEVNAIGLEPAFDF